MKDIEEHLQKEMKKINPNKEVVTIKDCMDVPLHRVFKYILLIKDYIKKLPSYHPDYQTINEAMKTFHDINN